MFQDQNLCVASFHSCWRTEPECRTSSTQTSEILTYDSESQAVFTESVSSQTDPVRTAELHLADVADAESLAAFLKRVEGEVCGQLDRNVRSRAFDSYNVEWEDTVADVTCIHHLCDKSMMEKQYAVTDVSWNCSGTVLAASYGYVSHQDWCSHPGHICVWHLQQKGLDPSRASLSIETPSCCTSLSYHPTEPAVVAAGTFSGELCVWNTASEPDQVVAFSGLSQYGHQEPVSKVTWILNKDSRTGEYKLLSLGTDGKVLLWTIIKQGKLLQVTQGFRIVSNAVSHSIRNPRATKSTKIGATCLSFSKDDKTLFIVGGENGSLMKCSLISRLPTATSLPEGEMEFHNPVTFVFKNHFGPVYAVDSSPFHRNIFLSSSTDSTVRMYSFLEANPLLTVEPGRGCIYSVAWSLSRPLLFVLGTEDGRVLIYDLKESPINPVNILEPADQKVGAVQVLLFNNKRPQVLAAGHVTGHVTVWRLSSKLCNMHQNEEQLLDDIASQTYTF